MRDYAKLSLFGLDPFLALGFIFPGDNVRRTSLSFAYGLKNSPVFLARSEMWPKMRFYGSSSIY
jgi:hypothetical protein